MPRLKVNVLGSFEVLLDDRPLRITAGRLRTFLAALALSAGKFVAVELLITEVLGDDLPAHPRRTLQTYAGRLRRQLGASMIETGGAGFRLRVDRDDVDALRFIGLLNRADAAPDAATERGLLVEALALWRGEPFGGVTSAWLETTEHPRLLERYLTALERRIDLDIAAGHAARLVPQLSELTSLHPLREPLWLRLLTVLDHGGRQAEALERYEQIRGHIADTLGVDPSPELQRAYADLLDGRRLEVTGGASPPAHATVVPRQLPADNSTFVGRDEELKSLHELLDGDAAGRPVRICLLAGTAGVGKTTLAVRWAHQVADRFPDGQLFVDLHGFGPIGRTSDPAEVVRVLLDALGIRSANIPVGAEGQYGLLRSLLAERRMLIVLDNARDAEQVRPLLPGSTRSMVIITSRNQLTGLVAAQAAHPVALDVLSWPEARRMLAVRLGPDRIEDEPAAVRTIVDMCARLPLALAIVAAKAAMNHGLPLASLAAELQETRDSLDALDSGDAATDVRSVFSWSYRAVSDSAARLFRLLGLHPGPEISTAAAASLAGLPLRRTRPLLAELVRAHMLTEHQSGRYTCHDLLRSFANELTHAHDTDADRLVATHRILDHYLHTGFAASKCIHERPAIDLGTRVDGVTAVEFTDRSLASGWFSMEHRTIMAVIGQAAERGFDTHAWRLAWTLTDYFARRGAFHELTVINSTALTAARRAKDLQAQAFFLWSLGKDRALLNDFDASQEYLDRALDLCTQIGDLANLAYTHNAFSVLCNARQEYDKVHHHLRQALDLFQRTDLPGPTAGVLNNLGWRAIQIGDLEQAKKYCMRALTLAQSVGARNFEAMTLDSLGVIHHRLGDSDKAVAYYQQAAQVFDGLGDEPLNVAETTSRLGEAHQALGHVDRARECYRRAIRILDDLNHPEAEHVRAKLRDLAR